MTHILFVLLDIVFVFCKFQYVYNVQIHIDVMCISVWLNNYYLKIPSA